MTVLPIVERELRVAARRPGTYWGRAGAALVALAIMAFIFLSSTHAPARQLGQALFITLSVIFLGVSLLAGVRYTADCLSEEKREGTMGLLFLTDLKGYDIVLGKLAATSVNAFYSLLAIFPVLAIPLLIGGVSFGEFGRMVLVLADTLLFSLAAGMLASALSYSARKAMAGTFLLILVIHGGIPALGAYLSFHYQARSVEEFFLIPSAGFAYALVNDQFYRTRPSQFLWSIGVIHGMTWILLLLASIRARHSWQDRVAGAVRTRWRERWQRRFRGDPQTAWRIRARLLDRNPCLWLGGRHRVKHALVWLFLLTAAGLWLAGYLKWPGDWLGAENYVTTAILLHAVLKVWVASEACQRFGPDRRSGALELVLSTPLTVKEMLHGQMLALRRQFFWPVMVVLLVDLIFLIGILGEQGGGPSSAWWTWLGVVGIGTFLLDLQALAWVGMWTGLTAKHPNRASGTAVAHVLVFFWILFAGFFLLAESLNLPRPINDMEYFILFFYLGLGVLLDLALWFWARFRLEQNLRSVATQRFEPRRSFLARLLSGKQPTTPPPSPAGA
jgi:ABC-type transport system involved in multi-copper enzyme maturation permease subunit